MAEFAGDNEQELDMQVNAAYEDMKPFNLPIKKMGEKGAKKYWTFRRESFNLLRKRLSGLRTAPTIDDIVVHPRCKHLIDELTLYSYKIDKLTSEILPVLEDKDNHVIDALRYALEGMRKAVIPKDKQAVKRVPIKGGWMR